jgi:hypothetical protein
VASRSKTWTVFARSNTGIVGSNPIWGMNVSLGLFCDRADPPSKESYQLSIRFTTSELLFLNGNWPESLSRQHKRRRRSPEYFFLKLQLSGTEPFTYSYACIYISVCLSVYVSTAFVDLGLFFSFLIYTQSIGILGQDISPSQGRYLHKRTHISMLWVGFEPTIPLFEGVKTVHGLNRAATLISNSHESLNIFPTWLI